MKIIHSRIRICVALALAFLYTSLHAQLEITSYTIDGGGGTSAAGSFELTGTIGQSDASTSVSAGTYDMVGGFWSPTSTNPTTSAFALWAASNLPPGSDFSFDGDANNDGFANGLAYVFGDSGIEVIASGIITAPILPVPADVRLYLEASDDLENWGTVLEYFEGVQVGNHDDININNGVVTDANGSAKRYYRYRALHLP